MDGHSSLGALCQSLHGFCCTASLKSASAMSADDCSTTSTFSVLITTNEGSDRSRSFVAIRPAAPAANPAIIITNIFLGFTIFTPDWAADSVPRRCFAHPGSPQGASRRLSRLSSCTCYPFDSVAARAHAQQARSSGIGPPRPFHGRALAVRQSDDVSAVSRQPSW